MRLVPAGETPSWLNWTTAVFVFVVALLAWGSLLAGCGFNPAPGPPPTPTPTPAPTPEPPPERVCESREPGIPSDCECVEMKPGSGVWTPVVCPSGYQCETFDGRNWCQPIPAPTPVPTPEPTPTPGPGPEPGPCTVAGIAGIKFPNYQAACDAKLEQEHQSGHLTREAIGGRYWYWNQRSNKPFRDWFDDRCVKYDRPGGTPSPNYKPGQWFAIKCEEPLPTPTPTPTPDPDPTPTPEPGDCFERVGSVGVGFGIQPRTPQDSKPACRAGIRGQRNVDVQDPAADCLLFANGSAFAKELGPDGRKVHVGDDPGCFDVVEPYWEQDPGCVARDDCVDIGVWTPIEPGSSTWKRVPDEPRPARGYFAKFQLDFRTKQNRLRACLPFPDGTVMCSTWRTLYHE